MPCLPLVISDIFPSAININGGNVIHIPPGIRMHALWNCVRPKVCLIQGASIIFALIGLKCINIHNKQFIAKYRNFISKLLVPFLIEFWHVTHSMSHCYLSAWHVHCRRIILHFLHDYPKELHALML